MQVLHISYYIAAHIETFQLQMIASAKGFMIPSMLSSILIEHAVEQQQKNFGKNLKVSVAAV